MKIYKQYNGENKQDLTTKEDVIKYCEGGGYWKKGTALKVLKETGQIHTPFATYSLIKN